jgi:hypothetical protein
MMMYTIMLYPIMCGPKGMDPLDYVVSEIWTLSMLYTIMYDDVYNNVV